MGALVLVSACAVLTGCLCVLDTCGDSNLLVSGKTQLKDVKPGHVKLNRHILEP